MKNFNVSVFIIIVGMLLTGCTSPSKTSGLANHEESPKSSQSNNKQNPEGVTAPDMPTKVHLSWTMDPTTTMTVVWQTETVESGGVDFGSERMPGPFDSYSVQDKILKTDYGIIHEVTLIGLAPGTSYHYRCGSGEGGWGSYYSFTTATSEKHFRFVVLGDTQHFRDVRRRIASLIKAHEPLFMVQCGDMVNLGYSNSLWSEWFDDMQDLISSIPLMPVMGNHDNYCMQMHGLCRKMYEQFALPDNGIPQKKEYWYSIDVAGTHFTMLNSEREAGLGPNTPQYRWLQDDLEKSAGSRWLFAFMHKPPFSMGAHGDDESVKKYWVPIFDRYSVDAVFSGHEHLYERTRPLMGGHPSEKGTVYIVSGSSGSVLYPLIRKFIKTSGGLYETVSSRFCFISVDVHPYRIEVNVIGLKQVNGMNDGEETIESFTIENNPDRLR
jgi:acid phosphatase type 7